MSQAAAMNNTPAYGAALRDEWGLEPDFLTVNHGSYGATPKAVLAEQDRWRRRMEAQPTRFFSLELPGALREAAGVLALRRLGLLAGSGQSASVLVKGSRFMHMERVVQTLLQLNQAQAPLHPQETPCC